LNRRQIRPTLAQVHRGAGKNEFGVGVRQLGQSRDDARLKFQGCKASEQMPMGLLDTQGLTRCTRLRLGCEPLSPSCKRIGGGKITRTHAPFNILRQLGEVFDLLFQLVQVGLGQMQGAQRFAQSPR
jgi:hypothetical protein